VKLNSDHFLIKYNLINVTIKFHIIVVRLCTQNSYIIYF